MNRILGIATRTKWRSAALFPAFRTAMTLLGSLLFTCPLLAQIPSNVQTVQKPFNPSVAQSPPPMSFDPWKEVGQTEEGTEYLEEFPSPVTSPYPVNNTVPLRVFLPVNATGKVPVVLVLHYWGAPDLRSERALAQELNRVNIAAAVMTLPYHLTRTPPGHHSGDMAIEPDTQRLIATMTQAVLDTRRSLDFLASRSELDHSRVGLTGTSLGALVAALTFSVDDRITHATFILGGVNLANIIWNSSLLVRQRDALRRRGYTQEKLGDAIQSIEPLKYLQSRRDASSFVIAGQYDTVIPRQSTDELIASLSNPKVLWLDTGHYGGIFVQRRIMREVAKYYAAEFGGGHFVAPKKLYAPTIRVGLKADTGNGFDLGVGLDLIKFDKRGDQFATLLLTPRGPQVFIGQQVFGGMSIGAVGSTTRIGIGLFWSAVL